MKGKAQKEAKGSYYQGRSLGQGGSEGGQEALGAGISEIKLLLTSMEGKLEGKLSTIKTELLGNE